MPSIEHIKAVVKEAPVAAGTVALSVVGLVVGAVALLRASSKK